MNAAAAMVVIDGETFSRVTTVDALCDAIADHGKGALLFPSLEYGDVLQGLARRLAARHGERSAHYRELIPAALVCAGCLWEFPGSFKLSLQGGMGFAHVMGARPGASEFGLTGACPRCASTDALLVYQLFPAEGIGEDDVRAIVGYWREAARAFWAERRAASAVCDQCNREIARGQGALAGSSLLCDACVRDGIEREGLARLRSEPHYYGAGLLRKARAARAR